MKMFKRISLIGGVGLAAILVVLSAPTLITAASNFVQQLQPGDSVQITCPSELGQASGGSSVSTVITCATLVPTNTATPTNTAVPPTNTPSPTATMVMPMPTSTGTPIPSGDGALGDSTAMHLWVPTSFDTCTQAEHDSFYVIGPDGLRYPTWHPPVMTRANGTTCTFGHEHGLDPRSSAEFTIAQRRYAHQLPDGSLDLAHAGIPFGYMNQQMDNWLAVTGNTSMSMRHEDHVGHKITAVDNFQIGLAKGPGQPQFFYPGVTCNYIVEVHQGTHSKDAFENNLHQVLYNSDCSDGHGVHMDVMGKFGKVGEFNRICDPQNDRTTIITTGTDYASPGFPGTRNDGARFITDRKCVEAGFLVPQGQWSANPYEAWPVNIAITKANGTPVVDGLNLLFDVEDSIRYYWPGHASVAGGTVDNLGHFQDLCTENLNGRTFRGGVCDAGTRTAPWNDPRAGFRDLNRGTYLKPGVTHNAGGSTVWYTDPFGNNAQTTAFPGSVKQLVTLDSTNYAQRQNASETANVFNHFYSDGGRTVHAPN